MNTPSYFYWKNQFTKILKSELRPCHRFYTGVIRETDITLDFCRIYERRGNDHYETHITLTKKYVQIVRWVWSYRFEGKWIKGEDEMQIQDIKRKDFFKSIARRWVKGYRKRKRAAIKIQRAVKEWLYNPYRSDFGISRLLTKYSKLIK
jgi:hypothetical protein